ncbi:hypothetical protein SISNIDRAFT_459269 [Sistotremastrum niveocremeum HHB9708]|uniref:DUF3128 domain-containing protein n=2 Tax=Sistotremastraceae TaxID=3402574 RepID=A0A164PTZ4_9AGAM|nr:hypothetical protein SISNIDRAFT_459269 [Sistotremastrum niveocremeum HHB9708]KZT39071.1 hypothetical protein SISSUDRAFT_1046135 [Sistotremastrum suecicum HHB10207 ss-3]
MADVDFTTIVKEEVARLQVLHPTPEDVPSCLKLFDDFLNCNVLGSQMRSLYRYGQVSVCKPKFDEVKFCFSLRSYSPEARRDAWIQRRAEWWARRRLDKSSEDVWDIRTEPLRNWPRRFEERDAGSDSLIN